MSPFSKHLSSAVEGTIFTYFEIYLAMFGSFGMMIVMGYMLFKELTTKHFSPAKLLKDALEDIYK